VLPAFARSSDNVVGATLVGALNESAVVAAVPSSVLRDALRGFTGDVKAAAEKLMSDLHPGDAALRERINELKPLLSRGDAARGRELFHAARSTCSACHRIDGRGATIGPDLSRVGLIRSGDDLLEAIVMPSATYARGYEPVNVTTKSGRSHYGRLLRESASAVVVVDASGASVRVPRGDVASIEAGRVSLMPPGLDRLLSADELADLLAYLRSLK